MFEGKVPHFPLLLVRLLFLSINSCLSTCESMKLLLHQKVACVANTVILIVQQKRIGMISSLEWTIKLTFTLFPLSKMQQWSMNWKIIWRVIQLGPFLFSEHWKCQWVLIHFCFNILWLGFFVFDMTGCSADIHVIVKIESADSIPNLHSIITSSDGVIL